MGGMQVFRDLWVLPLRRWVICWWANIGHSAFGFGLVGTSFGLFTFDGVPYELACDI